MGSPDSGDPGSTRTSACSGSGRPTSPTNGPFGFYDRGFFADYTPGYLYPLWLVGVVGQFLGGVGDLIKLPAILTDVALALHRLPDRPRPRRQRAAGDDRGAARPRQPDHLVRLGRLGPGRHVRDGVPAARPAELWRGRPERAAILAVVAALDQAAARDPRPDRRVRHDPRGRCGRRAAVHGPEDGAGPSGVPRGSAATTGPIRIVSTGVAGFATAVLLSAPFGLSVVSFSGTAPFVDSRWCASSSAPPRPTPT